jgi:hypothetical protein
VKHVKKGDLRHYKKGQKVLFRTRLKKARKRGFDIPPEGPKKSGMNRGVLLTQ